jgi:DNA-binding transcriptional LysR family regulator
VTRSNVSRRLNLLEREFGAQLLRRTTRYVELTEAGRILYAHCLEALDALQGAQRRIDHLHGAVRGEIRVRIPPGLAHFQLKPLVLDFCRRHPELKLRLVINDQISDLVATKVDLAIHITSAPLQDHVATRVCGIGWSLVGTPRHLQALGRPLAHPDALRGLDLITPLVLGPRLEFTPPGGGAPVFVQQSPRIQSGDYPVLLDAALADLGIALLPDYAVHQAVASGALARVLGAWTVKGVGSALYIVRAPNRQPSSATQAFVELLSEAVKTRARHWDLSGAEGTGVAGGANG